MKWFGMSRRDPHRYDKRAKNWPAAAIPKNNDGPAEGNGEGNAEDNGGLNLPGDDGAAEKHDRMKKMVQGELCPGDFENVKVFYNLKEASKQYAAIANQLHKRKKKDTNVSFGAAKRSKRR